MDKSLCRLFSTPGILSKILPDVKKRHYLQNKSNFVAKIFLVTH
jgi:hypothetical protein